MENPVSFRRLVDEIRGIHATDPTNAETLIEENLSNQWTGLSKTEALQQMNRLISAFDPPSTATDSQDVETSVLSRIFPLLLGEKVAPDEVKSEQQLHRLAESFHIVFDALNGLVDVIDTSLYGGKGVGVETIRHVIGGRVKGDGDETSLIDYIDRIKRAFRDSQEASQQAAHAMVEEILTELDPKRISEEGGSRKFGPFQKAEFFKIYEEKFQKCRKWFDAGRFAEELTREFERNCHKLSQKQGG